MFQQKPQHNRPSTDQSHLGSLKVTRTTDKHVEFDKAGVLNRFNRIRDMLIKVAEIHCKGVSGERQSKLSKAWSQHDLSKHCGEMTEAVIRAMSSAVTRSPSPIVLCLQQEFLGEDLPAPGQFNHSRALLASEKGVVVIDPWYGEVRFYNADPKTGIVQIPNTVSSKQYHQYKVDPASGLLTALTAKDGKDSVSIAYVTSTPKLKWRFRASGG